MALQEITYATCTQCRSSYEASITSIIDIDKNPNLKVTFLRGQLNMGQCPQCGFSSELNAPILYHDSAKELALIFTPESFGLTHADSQRIIGDLTNRLMNDLPPEQRKAYLFTPRTFLTMESLKKAILEADGITEEIMQAQATRVQLLQRFMRVTDESQLKTLVNTHDDELDRTFFEVISSMIFEALSNGEQNQAQQLLALRQMIAELSSQGVELVAEIDKAVGFQPISPDALLERLKNATSAEEFIRLVQQGKTLIDYAFFQNLTGQIDALEADGKQDEAAQLKALRSRILDATAKIEEENRKMINRATGLIDAVIKAPDRKQFIQERLQEFDEPFFAILAANIQEATSQNQTAAAEQLTTLQHEIMSVIQENIPPELKLLNQLLQLPSPDMIKPTLEQNRPTITSQFFALVDRAKVDFEKQGQTGILDLLDRIKSEAEIAKQGGIILTP